MSETMIAGQGAVKEKRHQIPVNEVVVYSLFVDDVVVEESQVALLCAR